MIKGRLCFSFAFDLVFLFELMELKICNVNPSQNGPFLDCSQMGGG